MATQRPEQGANQPPDADEAPAAEPITSEDFIRMHGDPRFHRLKRSLYVFVFPMTAAFLCWYVLYVLLSGFARDFMGAELIGGMNVALVFGLLQFVSTFAIAILYSRYARNKLDPLSTELREELVNGSADNEGSRK